MHEHEQDDPEQLSEIEKLGYDPRDVPVEQTWKHAVGLFISCGVVMILAWLVMEIFDQTNGSSMVGKQDITKQARAVEPQDPFPKIQSNIAARDDIKNLRHEELVKTETYGWVDKGAGTVHIPVEEAMGKLLAEGLPVTSTQAPPSLGVAPGKNGGPPVAAGTGTNAAPPTGAGN